MNGTLIGLLLFFGVCIYILVDAHKLRNQSPDSLPSSRDKPNSASSQSLVSRPGVLWLSLGGVFFVMALSAYLSPQASSPSGRWRWLHEMFFHAFGTQGDVVLFSLIASAFTAAGVFQWRTQAPAGKT